jgi:hypothetical protein
MENRILIVDDEEMIFHSCSEERVKNAGFYGVIKDEGPR